MHINSDLSNIPNHHPSYLQINIIKRLVHIYRDTNNTEGMYSIIDSLEAMGVDNTYELVAAWINNN